MSRIVCWPIVRRIVAPRPAAPAAAAPAVPRPRIVRRAVAVSAAAKATLAVTGIACVAVPAVVLVGPDRPLLAGLPLDGRGDEYVAAAPPGAVAVPEPGAALLFAVAVAGFVAVRGRR